MQIIEDLIAADKATEATLPKMGFWETLMVVLRRKDIEPIEHPMEHGEGIPESLKHAFNKMGKTDFCMAVMDILAWLKMSRRFADDDAVGLIPNRRHSELLTRLLGLTPELSCVIEVANNRLQFHSSIPAEEKESVIRLVDRKYKLRVCR